MLKQSNELYEFGEFRLDVAEHILECAGEGRVEHLPEKAFQTLVLLVRRAGSLVTKEELLEHAWPDAVVEDNNLDKAIHAIRNALGEKRGGPKYIETVRKHGYRFVKDVNRVGPHETAAQVDANVPPYGRFTRSGAHAIIDRELWDEITGAGRSDGPDSTDPGITPEKLTDSAPTSTARFPRGRFVLTALVAVLVVVGAWAGCNFIGVRPNLTGASGSQATSERTGSPAFDLYMRGKVKVASENREDTTEAIALLEQAVAADPTLAKAHAALARGYNTMAFKYSTGEERKRWHENAEVAIEKALTLDPNLAEGHFARGLILWSNTEGYPHEQAIQSYKRSLALDPDNDETHHQLSFVYSHIGLLDEARGELGRALEINPNNTLARYRAGVYAQYQGRFEEALSVHKTIPRDFTPLLVDRTTSELLIQTGRIEDAERIVEGYLKRYPKDEGGSFTSVKALLSAKAGKRGEAEDLIRRAEEIGSDFGHFHHTAYNIACAYAAMGDFGLSVQWLERTADTGFPNYPYFQIDPNMELIRNDPKFGKFMEKLRVRWVRLKAVVRSPG
jgi:DNA-binding winged helix-turn-helix (wHTH) protein/Tfp pilus assembly protein PilF